MIDWTRAAVVGALAGAVFWAVAVYALITSEGAAAAWAAVGVVAVLLLALGGFLSRGTDSPEKRCYGAGLVLAPFTGVVPAAVFLLAGVAAEVGKSM